MPNGHQASAKRLKMAERSQQQLDIHFPAMPPEFLWHRKRNDGYISVPRTLPIVMQAIDDQSKGQPAGHTLFSLWTRSPDNSLVTIENPATFAAEAGFSGERAVDTWRKRMKRLRELWMIATKAGPSGDFHYVLLINPNLAVDYMYSRGWVQPGLYARFIDRVADIGAYGELEAFRLKWAEQVAAQQAAAKAAEAATPAPPVPAAPAGSETPAVSGEAT